MQDATVNRLAASAVMIVAGITFAESFTHIRSIAAIYGQPVADSYMTPVGIDVAIIACSLYLLRAARIKVTAPAIAHIGLWSGIAATAAANIGFGILTNISKGIGSLIIGSITSGWTSYMFVITAELAIGMVARAAKKRERETAKPATDAAPQPAVTGRKRGIEPAGFTTAVREAAEKWRDTGAWPSERSLADDYMNGNRHAGKRALAAAKAKVAS